jgi:hypothetical protein
MVAEGESTFASPTGHSSRFYRKVQGLVQSLAGELEREQRAVAFASTILPTNCLFLHQFDHYDGGGAFTSHFFAATATKLYKYSAGTLAEVTAVGTLAAVPVARNIDNAMHLSDGTSSWLFDGTNYVKDGFEIPPDLPTFVVTIGAGTPNKVSVNRYYWTTYADQTAARREHESSSSPRSAAGTTVVANNGTVTVYQAAGTITTSNASAAVVGVATAFSARHVGMKLYTSGQLQGTILSVTDVTNLTLTANAATTVVGGRFVIAPSRATHWYIYASSSEEDKRGLLLQEVLVTTVTYTDNNFMVGLGTNVFTNIKRPLLNDATNATQVMEVRAKRLFRRRESVPNQFTFTAYEEVLALTNGSPFECVPGLDTNTVSTQSNQETYPDDSDIIRAMIDYGGALMIGTEDEVTPWYGEGLDDFGFSSAPVFRVGVAGRNAWIGTSFGLMFVSYDRKIYLYPSRYVASSDDMSSLVEVGRPKRKDWEQIKGSDLVNVQLVHYNWGRRNWAVLCYQTEAGTYKTLGFDFESKGWFEFSEGCTAVAVWEVAAGKKVLIGARTDKKIYVLDDLTGTYTGSGNYPIGTVRELIDFESPDSEFIIDRIQFELSVATLAPVVTMWLDPTDPENPDTESKGKLTTSGAAATMALGTTKLGANHYRCTPVGGVTCQRVLVEIVIPANTVSGTIRGLAVYASAQPWAVNRSSSGE